MTKDSHEDMFWSDISARWWSNSAEHKERTVCWCNQSQLRYSIIRVPQKYADLDGVVWSISQVIMYAFSKYYCSESRIAFFSCSSDVRVVLNCASLSRYSIKLAILFVRSNQNKPYPSLCVKPTSRLTIRNITTQTLDRKTFVSEWKSDFLTPCGPAE